MKVQLGFNDKAQLCRIFANFDFEFEILQFKFWLIFDYDY